MTPLPDSNSLTIATPLAEGLSGALFLARASKLLSASLDYEETLVSVAEMALPYLGSWCIVDILDEDGTMRRLAIIHPDPVKQKLARKLKTGWPPGRDDVLGLPRALQSQTTEVLPEVTDTVLSAGALNPDNLQALRSLGLGSVVVVPLMVRHQVLGAVTFVSADAGHQYTDADVEVAQDLAARCAMALENARLFGRAEDARHRAALLNEQLVLAGLREQELAEKAREATAAKSRFLAIMSHEIRTPISAIVAYTDLLELEISGPTTAKQKQYLARVKDSSRHLVTLLDDILDLSRAEVGRLVVNIESNPADRVLAAATSLVELQAASAGVTLTKRLHESEDAQDVWYLGDEDRVRQILVILLTNAIKFSGEAGSVVVEYGVGEEGSSGDETEGATRRTFLKVSDSGIGIAATDLSQIFEPFVQVDMSNTRKKGGSGLGLAIARELARQMNGDLTVRSVLGEGSSFTLWLPTA